MSKNRVYHDVSLVFSPDIVIFPGDPELQITCHMSIKNGDVANVSIMRYGSHTGTHIDAPRHFEESGAAVDELALDHFIGKAKVFEVLRDSDIGVEDIKTFDIQKGDIILFKTKNSQFVEDKEFRKDFAYITPEAAGYLADIGIKTLGFDYLSVEQYGSADFGAHHALLSKGVVLIEGLVLKDIKPGEYDFVALPLNIRGGNGSPVRAVLIEAAQQ